VELDPKFALAHRALSSVYTDLGEIGRGEESARKAYALREKLSERERFFIDSGYYFKVTGELEKAAEVQELWGQTYPRDLFAHGHLAVVSGYLGNWEKALEESRVAMSLNPYNQVAYDNLAGDLSSLNRLDEAEAVYKQAEERKLESEFLLAYRYDLAFVTGDTALMARMASAGTGKPGAEELLLASQADTEAWHGKLKNASELTRRAMDAAQQNDAKEAAALFQITAALREVESGQWEQARADANGAKKLASNRYVRAMAALALARAGDSAAEKLAAELDRTFPLDTLLQRYWLPTIRAAVALQRKDAGRAVELLKVANKLEVGRSTMLTVSLCPVYVRGEAYLMLHDGNAAAAEFQKFINHRGLVANFPWGALARLGLARAYALTGDTEKSLAAYREFLTLWKDADPDLRTLKEAKAEYKKLSEHATSAP
jgi:tetratricopeptide (TPR) repeat protein